MENSKMIYAQRKDFGLPSDPVTKYLKVTEEDFNEYYGRNDAVELSDKNYLRKKDIEGLKNKYLTIELVPEGPYSDRNAYFGLSKSKATAPDDKVVYFRINGGDWTKIEYKNNVERNVETQYELNVGDKLELRGENESYWADSSSDYVYLFMHNRTDTTSWSRIGTVKLSGEFSSLIGDYNGTIGGAYGFRYFLRDSIINKLILTDNFSFDTPKYGSNTFNYAFVNKNMYSVSDTDAFNLTINNLTRNRFNHMFYYTNFANDTVNIKVNCDAEPIAFQGLFELSGVKHVTIDIKNTADRLFLNTFKNCTAIEDVTLTCENFDGPDCLQNMFSGVTTTGTLYVKPEFVEDERILAELPDTWTIKAIGE